MLFSASKQLKTIKGETLKNEQGQPMTLGDVAVSALLANHVGEDGQPERTSGEEKFKRYRLALKLDGCVGDADITIDEAAKLKKLVAAAYAPIVVGQFFDALEAAPKSKSK